MRRCAVVTAGYIAQDHIASVEGRQGAVTVERRCADVAEVIAVIRAGWVDAALLIGSTEELTGSLLQEFDDAGVTLVVISDVAGERRRLRQLGICALPDETETDTLLAALRGEPILVADEELDEEASTEPWAQALTGVPGDADAAMAAEEPGEARGQNAEETSEEAADEATDEAADEARDKTAEYPATGEHDTADENGAVGENGVAGEPGAVAGLPFARRLDQPLPHSRGHTLSEGGADAASDADSPTWAETVPDTAPDAVPDTVPADWATSSAGSAGAWAPSSGPEQWGQTVGSIEGPAEESLQHSADHQADHHAAQHSAGLRGVVTVWGAPGSPGRTTVAVNLAAELALAGQRVLLIDADTVASSVAAHLGLLEESAGIAQACRQAELGRLSPQRLRRCVAAVDVGGARVHLLTGIPRAERWRELREHGLREVLRLAREEYDAVIVDIAAPLEQDEELLYDTQAPQRYAAGLTALRAADRTLAVGAADPVSFTRLVRAVEDYSLSVPEAPRPEVLVNQLRREVVGRSPEQHVQQAWERFGADQPIAYLLPWDREGCDRALRQGRALVEAAPGSALRAGIAELAGAEMPRRRGLAARLKEALPSMR